MRTYKSIYVPSKGGNNDTEEIARVVNIWTEDGGVLHSVVPSISEGNTDGYIILIDTTEME